MTRFALILAGIAALPPALVWAVRSESPPPPINNEQSFGDRYRVAVTDVALARPQESALPIVKRVRTETIRPTVEKPVEPEPERQKRPALRQGKAWR